MRMWQVRKMHFFSYKNSAHATWQFVHDIRVGDVVFVKKGNNGILGNEWKSDLRSDIGFEFAIFRNS